MTRKIEVVRTLMDCYWIHEESKVPQVSEESRWPLLFDILKEQKINVEEDVAWDKLFRSKKFKVMLTRIFHHVI